VAQIGLSSGAKEKPMSFLRALRAYIGLAPDEEIEGRYLYELDARRRELDLRQSNGTERRRGSERRVGEASAARNGDGEPQATRRRGQRRTEPAAAESGEDRWIDPDDFEDLIDPFDGPSVGTDDRSRRPAGRASKPDADGDFAVGADAFNNSDFDGFRMVDRPVDDDMTGEVDVRSDLIDTLEPVDDLVVDLIEDGDRSGHHGSDRDRLDGDGSDSDGPDTVGLDTVGSDGVGSDGDVFTEYIPRSGSGAGPDDGAGRAATKQKAGDKEAVVRSLDSIRAKPRTLIPESFGDAKLVADEFKRDIPVVLNLQSLDRELARRLIDFASGLCYALDGSMEKIASQVFLLTPTDVEVSDEDRRRIEERGYAR
jgi:FtsZ-interacting cell division protein YlmF